MVRNTFAVIALALVAGNSSFAAADSLTPVANRAASDVLLDGNPPAVEPCGSVATNACLLEFLDPMMYAMPGVGCDVEHVRGPHIGVADESAVELATVAGVSDEELALVVDLFADQALPANDAINYAELGQLTNNHGGDLQADLSRMFSNDTSVGSSRSFAFSTDFGLSAPGGGQFYSGGSGGDDGGASGSAQSPARKTIRPWLHSANARSQGSAGSSSPDAQTPVPTPLPSPVSAGFGLIGTMLVGARLFGRRGHAVYPAVD